MTWSDAVPSSGSSSTSFSSSFNTSVMSATTALSTVSAINPSKIISKYSYHILYTPYCFSFLLIKISDSLQ